MKYHGHEIKRVKMDLGENDERKNCIYEIYKNGEFIQNALSINSAKDYIDSNYNENYL